MHWSKDDVNMTIVGQAIIKWYATQDPSSFLINSHHVVPPFRHEVEFSNVLVINHFIRKNKHRNR